MISFVDSIIHSQNEQSNIHIQRQFNDQNVDSITVFFSKSQVLASSEVQTQMNFYMYAILLPVISATDLTSQKTGWSN